MEQYGENSVSLVFRGVEFYRTCIACPEQYDAWFEGTQIGYVRLRHGTLRADYRDYMGDTVYSSTIGDGVWQGCFTDDEERCYHLCRIADKLKEKYRLEVEG